MSNDDQKTLNFALGFATDSTLGELVSDAKPSWIWCAERSRIVWANPSALDFWAADSVSKLASRKQSSSVHGVRQLNRIAGSLPEDPDNGYFIRLERLRFFRHGRETTLTCKVKGKRVGQFRGVLVQTVGHEGVKIGKDAALVSITSAIPAAAFLLRSDGKLMAPNEAAMKLGFAVPDFDELAGQKIVELAPTDKNTAGQEGGVNQLIETPSGAGKFKVSIRNLAPVGIDADIFIVALQSAGEVLAKNSSLELLDQSAAVGAIERTDETKEPTSTAAEVASPSRHEEDRVEGVVPATSGAAALVAAVNHAFGAPNIVQFHNSEDRGSDPVPLLDENEQNAFQAIADALEAKLESGGGEKGDNGSVHTIEAKESRSGSDGVKSQQSGTMPDPNEFSTLLTRLPLAIFVYRGDDTSGVGEPIFSNRAFLRLFGYGSLENIKSVGGVAAVLPKSNSVTAPEDSPIYADNIAVVGENSLPIQSNSQNEMFIHDSSGVRIPVKARLQGIKWNRQNAMMLTMYKTATEIPEQNVAANLSANSANNELISIVDHILDAFLILDTEGVVKSISQGARQLFATEEDGVVGKSFSRLLREPSRHQAEIFFASMRDNLVFADAEEGCEVNACVAGNRDKSLILKIYPIESAANSLFCAVFNDISRWKGAEPDRAEKHEEAALHNERETTFLAKVSHELRTPLNSILGFSETILAEKFGPLENDTYRDYISDIQNSGTYLLSLVNDLLDIAKVESGKMALDFTNVDLNDVVAACIKTMQPEANKARIILRSNLTSNLADIVADERSLRQICLNLLSNAIKFTGPRGQVIVATRLTERGEMELRVHDTGTGMDNRELAVAMEPFRQVENGINDIPGTGLGLPLTKALVEENRARFDIASNKGQGTLIKITFPVSRVLAD